ncbi:DUF3995 domain-containing protein [Micromonospora sp. NPDC093277]|uniref:DUF3995 domain-containing protein n=1 Tax=Micromonospora sp. NPDC093277 TaxID=3364291 RepID=UPI00380A75D7
MTRTTATNTDGRRGGGTAAPAGRNRVRPGAWAGHGACLWSLLFAALSFYWAAGGLVGAGTIGPAVEGPALAREPAFVAVLWATAVLKLIAAALALALVHERPRWAPRWLLLLAGWGAAALLSLYAVANLAQHLLIVAGVIAVPAGLGRAALPWHLGLWDPIWLAGGLLFTLTAIRYSRLTSRTTQHKLVN